MTKVPPQPSKELGWKGRSREREGRRKEGVGPESNSGAEGIRRRLIGKMMRK
jgi:hypothetical protein